MFALGVIVTVGTSAILVALLIIYKTIIMTNAEAVAKLDAQAAQLAKVSTEVQALIAAVQNAGNVSAEVEAAIGKVGDALQGVDDLNPDA